VILEVQTLIPLFSLTVTNFVLFFQLLDKKFDKTVINCQNLHTFFNTVFETRRISETYYSYFDNG